MRDTIGNGGAGVDVGMHVDQNEQAHIFAITESEAKDALDKGNAFNMNTGWVSLSGTTALAWMKNDEDKDSPYVITGIAVGFKQGTVTDQPYLEIIRNPTAGTMIAADVDMQSNSNNNFSSNENLKTTTKILKGATGETFTDGTVHATLGSKLDSRSFYPLDIELGRGASIGVKVYPDLASGTVDCYVAFIGYRKDSKNK